MSKTLNSGSRHAPFAATRWSMVLRAAGDRQAGRADALDELIRLYWPPLYGYLRRTGHSPDAAADLTQDFFARLVEKKAIAGVDPGKGTFRSFLLASLKHFVSNQRDRDNAKKRGGGRTVAFDFASAESRWAPVDDRKPDDIFCQQWAMAVLNAVLGQLEAEYANRGQKEVFEALKTSLTAEISKDYAFLAAQLRISEAAVRVAVHRLRRRYRDLLRQHVAKTVSDPGQVDDELRDLLNSL